MAGSFVFNRNSHHGKPQATPYPRRRRAHPHPNRNQPPPVPRPQSGVFPASRNARQSVRQPDVMVAVSPGLHRRRYRRYSGSV
ncbi:hypothetical protein D6I54_19585 [Salmonella enterica]|nr:hypothetical protein [Salmonella enterica]